MKTELGLNPWLSIWVKPRQTMRALMDYNVNYRFIALCAIFGFQYMLQVTQFLSLGRDINLFVILLIALLLCIPVGYILFNISSAFLFWVGKLIKGKGTFKQIRAASYWTSVPNVVTILIWIVLMVLHGGNLFIAGYERDMAGAAIGVNVGASILQTALGIWMLVIFLHALGEVQKFSAWMALLNLFLSGLAIFIVMFIIGWGISALTHMS